MFTSIHRKDCNDKWHLRDSHHKMLCGIEIIDNEIWELLIIGTGNPKCQPDPPKDQMCPKCFKGLFK